MNNSASHTPSTSSFTHNIYTATVRPTTASSTMAPPSSVESTSSFASTPSGTALQPTTPRHGQYQIPTSALGPVTISVLVGLVVITCLILQFSKVRQKLASRRLLQRLRREERERQQLFEYQQLASSQGSWSSSLSENSGAYMNYDYSSSNPSMAEQQQQHRMIIDHPRPALTRHSTSRSSSSDYSFPSPTVHNSSPQHQVPFSHSLHR